MTSNFHIKEVDNFLRQAPSVVFGLPASKGIVEGSEEDAVKLLQGQIILAESPSSLINLILPKAAGIVCDFVATLSDAAVCARELGIPCVVGTKIASRVFKDGDRVRVNGTNGLVELIEKNES